MATPTGPIRTQVDFELQGAPRGPELAQSVAQRMRDRSPMAMPPTREERKAQSGELSMTWEDFQQRHPEWRGEYWAECRALYAGGDRLLGDPKVLERLFPQHLHEDAKIYAARKARAHYYPYAGTIIDHLLAGLGTDPLRLSFSIVDEENGTATLPASAEWWERWVSDVSDTAERPSDYGLEDGTDDDDDEGGTTLHHFVVDVLREALQTRGAWVLADLPPADEELKPITSKLDAEKHGLGDPYLSVVPAEQVVDWQTDDRGRLVWAMIMTQEQIRETPKDRRGKIRNTFVLWDAERWARYVIDVDPANPPQAETVVPCEDWNTHAFGRVPLERLVLPEGMHAMGKLHSLAREHFNKRCAMSWAEYKSLFAVLYEFNGAEDQGNGLPVAMAQTDSNRAVNQVRGQGFTQIRGKDDDARFIGPDVAPFKEARESCNDAMREMHRVMFSMALSASMDKAALQRSGESKNADNASTAVLLDAFGVLARKFMRRLLVLASLGRGEAVPPARTEGLEQFDVQGTADAITEAVEMLNGVPILSSLFRELYLARLYSKVLGDVSQEQSETIRKQIRESISEEETLLAQGMLPGAAGNVAVPGSPGDPNAGKIGDDDDDDDDDAPEDKGDKAPKEKRPTGHKSRPKPKR